MASRALPSLRGHRPWLGHKYICRAMPFAARPLRHLSQQSAASGPSLPWPEGRIARILNDTDYPRLDAFQQRHIGPSDDETIPMLKALDPPAADLDSFIAEVIPKNILSPQERRADSGFMPFRITESSLLKVVGRVESDRGERDLRIKSFLGQGYYGTLTPPVIQRNVLESPAWYTSYTPYQPEVSQGRLESLVNFQTMVADLTGLPIANASLLDEGTAAAEAMTLSLNALPVSRAKRQGKTYVVSSHLHPQTIGVMRARAEGFGITIQELDLTQDDAVSSIRAIGDDLVGVMVQYPDTNGLAESFESLAAAVHEQGALLSAATDLLALTLLKPPGEWGADVAFGSSQRFGVPMGFGGPHAAFFAVNEKHKRKIPGRLVGLSKDRLGNKAYRLALQTREQHIRREKATSNVCTSQALLANMSAFYGVYHGPEGLKAIAERVVRGARVIEAAAAELGFKTIKNRWSEQSGALFDTVVIEVDSEERLEHIQNLALLKKFAFRFNLEGQHRFSISVDETTNLVDLEDIIRIFYAARHDADSPVIPNNPRVKTEAATLVGKLLPSFAGQLDLPDQLRRTSSFMTHPVFNTHHSETEMLRYIHHLQSKDISLVHSMIPLGSCTMKLNGTTEMSLITRPFFSQPHPYIQGHHSSRYKKLLEKFSDQLSEITGMDDCSLQPNSGAQGEFAGLRAIRDYHKSQGNAQRDICLIPVSAHGTNPASAAMAGMRVVPIKCDTATGNLDMSDLEAKCEQHRDQLAAIMITYPSTFGVFEPEIKQVCEVVHAHGGQVYMDGANMNAQIGLCSPGQIGADVCHLNLHKTFCIPHGGGGPGVGPICMKEHLRPFKPGVVKANEVKEVKSVWVKAGQVQANKLPLDEAKDKPSSSSWPVSSSEYGSASINLISWAYNSLMGLDGLRQATKIGLLNANYLMSRLKPHYPILYKNEHGRCAHEFILDTRGFSKSAGIEAIDIAKRLQDYGFHAPTMSWPVANTLMIEPTESESKEELDRFVDALVSIRQEIREVEEGKAPRTGNVLKMAPHPMQDLVMGDGDGQWDRSYSRKKAAYPLAWLQEKKFWPSVARVDDTYGDLNLFCTCPPVEDTTGGEEIE
ncbi:glycine dehydrogenase [Xylariomycetidae sp. FL0641]|nr:glycine dehydrogenase [Xylariomycetidae sp. FL0641]